MTSPDSLASASRSRVMAKGVLWNIAGYVIPLLVAIVSIPALIHLLGLARFGLLTLVWALVGYFSLLDLGLGRAVTKLISEAIADRRSEDSGAILLTAMVLMAGIGFVGAVAVFASTDWLVSRGLGVPTELASEARLTCYVLAVTIPFVTTGSALLGYLSALHRFDIVNTVRIPIGMLNYLAPLLVASFVVHLAVVVSVVVATRIASWLLYGFFSVQELRKLNAPLRFDRGQLRPLFSFGAWITISNILSPVMLYLDRFVLASMMSVAAVAYYTTPYEGISKLWILPSALIMVLFPALAHSHVAAPDKMVWMYARAVKAIGVVLFPVSLLLIAFAQEGLSIWIGPEFALHSYRVLQILTVGVFVNSLAQVPSTLIQSIGRPDVNAKLHLVELPLYVLLLFLLTRHFGLAGAAIAWTTRIVVDGVALWMFAGVQVRGTGLTAKSSGWVFVSLAAFVIAAAIESPTSRACFVVSVLIAFAGIAWTRFLTEADRALMVRLLSARKVNA